MRALKPVVYKDSQGVVDTLNSLKIAESLTGGKFPERNDPEQVKALKPTPVYHLADDDDWEDDTGDSVVETRKSIRQAENQLKERWFINKRERLDFNDKVHNGTIRGDVLNFNNTDDADNLDSADEIENREAEKKAAAVA